MKIQVLGSSSSGNGYIVTSEKGEQLLIEAGLPFADTKKALGFDLTRVDACLVSHRHGDHAKHVENYAKAGIAIYTGENTAAHCQSERTRHFYHALRHGQPAKVGNWKVLPLNVHHDAPCMAFVVEHQPDAKRLAFVTDTMSFPYKLPQCDVYMIEANYADSILERNISEGREPASMRARLLNSHMELQTTVDALRMQDLSRTDGIMLLHLSSRNSDRELFRATVETATGLPTTIAAPGVTVDF